VAIGLRLGAPIVCRHSCVSCGKDVDPTGHHGLSCKQNAGRYRRHSLVNDILVKAVRATGVHAKLEPHLLRGASNKRPDGATMEPWRHGKDLLWDFTCPDILAASHVSMSAISAGTAATRAEQSKNAKYAHLAASNSALFMPAAIETLGTWGPSARELCKDIGSCLAALTGDPRAHIFLVQRLALAVQRGNALAVAGTFSNSELTDEYTDGEGGIIN